MRSLILIIIVSCYFPLYVMSQSHTIAVNISQRTVDGIDMTQSSEILSETLGAERVQKDIEYLEGDPHEMYVIDFNGHKVYKHWWNGFSFSDSVFVTEKSVRIGSTIAEFDSVYGQGELMWSEAGFVIHYRTKKYRFSLLFPQDYVVFKDEKPFIKDRNCRSRRIWIR